MSTLFFIGLVVTMTTTPSEPLYLNPGMLALTGTIFGGVGLKVVEKLMARGQDTRTSKRDTTRDYRGEISELVTRMDKLESEVGFWRGRYYEEQENNAVLRIAMIQAGLTPPRQVVIPPDSGEPEEKTQ